MSDASSYKGARLALTGQDGELRGGGAIAPRDERGGRPLGIVAGVKMATTTDTGVLSDQEWALLREDLGLSPRQAQIVKRISQAMSDKQIARELGVSLSTVRTHMGRLFQKYDLNDRMELLVHVFSLLRSHWRNGELSPSQSVTDVDSGCEYPSVR